MDDGSRRSKPSVTVGIDLGDKYSHLCLLDTDSGEVIEEGLLCALPPKLSGGASLRSSRCESLSRRAPTPPG